MELKTLQADMIKAMKEKDKVTKDAISGLIAAIKKVAIDEGVRDNITEELTDRVILKELKSVKEQIDSCPEESLLTISGTEGVFTIFKLEIRTFPLVMRKAKKTAPAFFGIFSVFSNTLKK